MDSLKTDFILFGNGSGWFGNLFEDVDDTNHLHIGKDNFSPWKENKLLHYMFVTFMGSKFRSVVGRKTISKLLIDYLVRKIKHSFPKGAICVFNRTNVLAHNEYLLSSLREKCSEIKLVYWFTDIVSAVCKSTPNVIDLCKKYFDVVITFDPLDATEYSFIYLETPYSYRKHSLYDDCNSKTIDLLYIGRSKLDLDSTRLKKILLVYEMAIKSNLKCDFTIIDVPLEMQKYSNSIVYNEYLPYETVIEKVKKSKCLLEISQEGERGTTLRMFESIAFGVHFLFTNECLLNHPYFLPDRMNYLDLDTIDRIDFSFINRGLEKHEEIIDKLSPTVFLNSIYDIIQKEQT